MNDEIREILDYLQENSKKDEATKQLVDYITNLQQENERLKQPKIFIDTQDMEERYGEELYKDYLEKQVKDYKSRCEKAVKYIKEAKEQDFMWLPIFEKELLNILNGRSDE